MIDQDIIAAPATAWGEAAVGIVRLSGAGSTALVEAFFVGIRPLRDEPPRRMVLGAIRDVDTVLAVRFERGSSYTGEESVEVHCHGGGAAVAECMRLFLAAGARVAEPGEFTKRAFLSGRLDLAQAEAVLGVIRASSAEALEASRRTLQGELSAHLRELLDAAVTIRAGVEASLDFPEDEPTDDLASAASIAELCGKIERARDRCRAGMALDNGVSVALVGPPNVGKSSLLNAICGSDQSIVTAIPGTTRDTVRAQIIHRGMPMIFLDTAGIRDASDADEVERIGIERARRAADRADVIAVVADASNIEASRAVFDEAIESGRIVVAVINKIDLADGEVEWSGASGAIRSSAVSGSGVEEIKDAVFDAMRGGATLSGSFAASSRVVSSLDAAAALAREAIAADAIGDAGLVGSLLGDLCEKLAAPLGADASEEVIDEIFSRFCVGK